MYYEGWDPSKTPERYSSHDEFLQRLADQAQLAGPTEASHAADAATRVLRRHVTEGEVEDVLQMLPDAIRRVLEPS